MGRWRNEHNGDEVSYPDGSPEQQRLDSLPNWHRLQPSTPTPVRAPAKRTRSSRAKK